MHHRLPTRVFISAATLATVAVATGCADDRSDGSATPDTGSPVMSATSSSSTPPRSTTSPADTSARTSPRSRAETAERGTERTTPTPPTGPPRGAPAPPFIASAAWEESDYGVTLKVAPTPAGREAWGTDDSAAAWEEVLRLHPNADVPGMWEQFDCHWTWARLLEPNKPTWNVEPWRPVVSPDQMLADGCNPGGPEV